MIYHQQKEFTLMSGNSLDLLPTLAHDSLDACVTDPPYELGFMGKTWDRTGIANNVELWRGVWRVLKPGAWLLAFGGTRTHHRMVCAIEDAGFEIRDEIDWVYGSGFPKSHNLEGEREGWGTALKPAKEPICLARKPLAGTVAANVAKWGTGALNVDGCRVMGEKGSGNWDGMGGTALKLYEGGFSKPTASDENARGRWPANLIHDGSPEVLAAFPDAPGAQGEVTGTEPSAAAAGTRCYGVLARTANSVPRGDEGSAARFFYVPKADRTDRDEGLDGDPLPFSHDGRDVHVENPYQRHDSMARNFHTTVKPTDLMRYLCRLVTPPGGTVIDPFNGSGSTGKAAIIEGFHYVGMDMTPEYLPISKARILYALQHRERWDELHAPDVGKQAPDCAGQTTFL